MKKAPYLMLMIVLVIVLLVGCGETPDMSVPALSTTTAGNLTTTTGDVTTTTAITTTTVGEIQTTTQATTTKKATTTTSKVTTTTTKATTTITTTTTTQPTTTTTAPDPAGTVRVYSDNKLFSVAIPKEMATVMQQDGYYEGISVISDWSDTVSAVEDIRLCSREPYDNIDGLGTDVEFIAISNEDIDELKAYWEEPVQFMAGGGDMVDSTLDSAYELKRIATGEKHTIYCVFEDSLGWADCQFGKPCTMDDPKEAHILLHILWDKVDVMIDSFRWEK